MRAESGPGPDPASLRERLPEVLTFIRNRVQESDGEELMLLLEALDTQVRVAPEEADMRVEVPMVEGFDGTGFVTIEQTSAWTLDTHKPEPAYVPFRRTFARPVSATNRK